MTYHTIHIPGTSYTKHIFITYIHTCIHTSHRDMLYRDRKIHTSNTHILYQLHHIHKYKYMTYITHRATYMHHATYQTCHICTYSQIVTDNIYAHILPYHIHADPEF